MLPVVIIAAGKGTRLYPYTRSAPKCLLELAANVSILDFALQKLESMGMKEVYIITREEYKKEIENRVGDRAKVEVIDYSGEFNNLYPVVWAIKNLKLDKFLLLMSDHVFEKEMLKKIVEARSDKAFILCLDRRPSWSKAVEGLKLKCSLDSVYEVGKTITPLHGIDTGLILCNQKAHKYILDAFEKLGFKASVSDALKLAAEEGQVGFVDVTGLQWLDVDFAEDLIKARKLYWKILRKELKSETSNDIIIKYLIKPVSTRFSTYLYRVGFSRGYPILQLLGCAIALLAVYLAYFNLYLYIVPLVPTVLLLDEITHELLVLNSPSENRSESVISLLLRTSIDVILMLAIGLLYRGVLYRLIVPLAISGVALTEYANLIYNITKSPEVTFKERIPTARGIRYSFILIALLLGAPSLALVCSVIILLLSIIQPITGYFSSLRGLSFRTLWRPPIPSVKPSAEDMRSRIRYSIEVILTSILNLLLCTIFIWLIGPYIPEISVVLGVLEVKLDLVVQLVYGIIVLIYGYRMVNALKFLTEILWERIAERLHVTSTVYGSIVLNVTYILILVFLWYAIISPISIAIGKNNPILPLLMSGSVAIMMIALIYRLVKMARVYLTGYWNKLLEYIADKMIYTTSSNSPLGEVKNSANE